MARRRIERLQGVQFCRRTMEIRSEVSRPPDLFRTASPGNRKVSSLLFSDSGGLGLRQTLLKISGNFSVFSPIGDFPSLSVRPPSTNELSHGGLCPHPPRNLRFLGFSFCCRLFGRTEVAFWSIGASRDHRGAAPSLRTSPAPETYRSGQAVTTTAQTASISARQRLRAASGRQMEAEMREVTSVRVALS